MTGIVSPLQPRPPQPNKMVNVKVELKRNAIPPMLKWLAWLMLTILAYAVPAAWIFFDTGWEKWAAFGAMVAWTGASVDAILEHIIKQTPDERREITQEITRAQQTHLMIK